MSNRTKFDKIIRDFTNIDKDLRFMALNDLEEILSGVDNVTLDADTEKKICSGIVKLLDDKSPPVQGRAIATLAVLIKKITKNSLSQILAKLVDQVVGSGKSAEERDIASLGLGNVIRKVEESHGAVVVQCLSTPLVKSLSSGSSSTDDHYRVEALNNLDELLKRFGQYMSKDFAAISRAVLPCLASNPSNLKPATSCLANFARVIPDDLFTNLVTKLIEKASQSKDAAIKRTYIQVIGAIGRSVAHRLGKFMSQVVPLISDTLHDKKFDEDMESKDNCLRTFTSLISQCPQEISPFIDNLMKVGLEYITFDPNIISDHSDDDQGSDDGFGDDDGFGGDDGSDDGFGGDDGWDDSGDGFSSDDDDDFVGDDDGSWQVRKASAQLLSSIIGSRSDLLGNCYDKVAPVLIKRFSETESTVRLEVLRAFQELLKQTIANSSHSDQYVKSYQSINDQVIESLHNVLSAKRVSDETCAGVFHLLCELLYVTPNILNESQIEQIVKSITAKLKGKQPSKSKNLPVSAAVCSVILEFVRRLISSHNATLLHPHFTRLTKICYAVDRDPQMKQLDSSALSTFISLTSLLKPTPSSSSPASSTSDDASASSSSTSTAPSEYSGFDYAKDLKLISSAIRKKVESTDIDQEVKEVAIAAASNLLAVLGTKTPQAQKMLGTIINTHLPNEITRLAAVKGLHTITCSRYSDPLYLSEPQTVKAITSMSGLLRKNSRPLRLETLHSLRSIYSSSTYTEFAKVQAETPKLLEQTANLIDVRDLQICQLSLALCVTSLQAQSSVGSALKKTCQKVIYQKSLKLVESPLLQGEALQEAIKLFSVLVKKTGVSYDSLLENLISIGSKTGGNSLQTVAGCVAAISATQPSKKRKSAIAQFVQNITKPKSNLLTLLSLLCVSEIGRKDGDLVIQASGNIDSVLTSLFTSESEEIKTAAAQALGSIAFGSPKTFLPKVVGLVENDTKHLYLSLQALREIVLSALYYLRTHSSLRSTVSKKLKSTVSLLFKLANASEEGTRNVVAECLGRLAFIFAQQKDDSVFEQLLKNIGDSNANIRASIVTAVKFSIVERDHAVDDILRKNMEKFLSLLKDENRTVQRAAIITLTYAAHNKPDVIRDQLKWIQPILYSNAPKKPELVRIVQLGPFQHEIDDGLPVRKATFECLHTLLSHCISSLQLNDYLAAVNHGLSDIYDIKMLCHLKLCRLATSPQAHSALIVALPKLLNPLRETLATETKKDTAAQDRDRNEEQIRSALKSVAAIASHVTHVQMTSPQFKELLNDIHKGALAEQFAQISSSFHEQSSNASSASSSSSSSSSAASSSSRN